MALVKYLLNLKWPPS